jgi:REP element-mobilizing transposase RayT
MDNVIKRSGRNLPHWTSVGGTHFITWRQCDSLPQATLRRLRTETQFATDQAARDLGRALTDLEMQDIKRSNRIHAEQELDRGLGSCLMKDPRAAEICVEELTRGGDYRLHGYVVMPNHVHVLVEIHDGLLVENLCYRWKYAMAYRINALVGRRGRLWQSESWDHIVRSEVSYFKFRRYLLENPKKAGLEDWPFCWVLPDKEI